MASHSYDENVGEDDSNIAENTSDSVYKKRQESIQKIIEKLIHAVNCKNESCTTFATCNRLKQILSHLQICKNRKENKCSVCKQMIALCCFHAKQCKAEICQIPFCRQFKLKFAEKDQKKFVQEFKKFQLEDVEEFISM
uniref:histone acetyltransferase n=1 Tax=Panagrolaimus davidi TaxID=227884 RepID=A0A914PUF7_9BILA